MTQTIQTTQEPIRCLVIQMARLGDTLQSLMALRAAKQLYPQLEIHFLVRERFADAVKRIPWIHKIIILPTDVLLAPVLQGLKNETQALGDLARWIAPLVKEPWDFVVNWTFSESSSYLTALLPARIKLGYTRRRDSTFAGTDGWSHYIQAVVQGKVHQDIHLTDILTTQFLTALQIHVGEPIGSNESAVTSKSFFNLTLSEKEANLGFDRGNKKWIAIQLGAGTETKTWNPKSWAKLASYILQRHPDYGIYLLGGEEDKIRAESFFDELTPALKESPAIISLVGKSSFDLWTSVVSKSQWLIAGDTAAIHLASVLGVRVLNVSVGPVRHLETGPYGNGHYILTPEAKCNACSDESPALPIPTDATSSNHSGPIHASSVHTCKDDISPEAVYAVWSYASNEWAHQRLILLESHFSNLGWTTKLNAVRIYRSKIRNTSDGGGVFYEPMLHKPLSLDEWTAMVMGHLARAWYCGWLPPVGKELIRGVVSPKLIQKLRELEESTQVLLKICQKACQTSEEISKRSSHLKSDKVMGVQDRAELQQLGKTLLELEDLLERTAKTNPSLLAFSQMSKVLLHHLKSTHLAELGKETAECYKQLNEGVVIFRQWIQFTLELAKPVAIKPPGPTLVEVNL